MDLKALKAQCTVIRRDIITMLEKSGSGHPGRIAFRGRDHGRALRI